MRHSPADIYPLFRTPVEVPEPCRRLQVSHRHVFLGSCFADKVGSRFEASSLLASVNPLGVLYNPSSIATVLRYALDDTCQLTDEWFVENQGMFHCWLTDGSFSICDLASCRIGVGKALHALHDDLLQCDNLFITLGTNHCYMLSDSDSADGFVVSNCHRLPQKHFVEHELSVDEIVQTLGPVFDRLLAQNPRLCIFLTVSPYRYRKYGFHGSQLGKATLLLSVNSLLRRNPERMGYFPAYEIVMDELRDYRFYADDMLHPSQQAVEYIFRRLTAGWMDERMQEFLSQMEKVNDALNHRPLHADDPSNEVLYQRAIAQRKALLTAYGIDK